MKSKNIINSIIILAVFIVVFLMNTSFVFSTPARWGIAINSENKTCTNYWAGDEEIFYSLPNGWKSYYPEMAYRSLDTSLGSCKFYSSADFYTREITDNWKSCFSSMSCNYVDYDNFNKSYSDLLSKNYCVKLSDDKMWGTSLAVDVNKKQCTFVTCSHGIASVVDGVVMPYIKYPNGLEIYSSRPQEYITFETKAGNCTIKRENSNDFSECCGQLGYTFIEDIIQATGNINNNEPEKLIVTEKNNAIGKNLDNNLVKNTNRNLYVTIVIIMVILSGVVVCERVLFRKYKNKKNVPPSSEEPSNSPLAD